MISYEPIDDEFVRVVEGALGALGADG